VADIVAGARAHPGAALVASGDAGLAGVLAAGLTSLRLAVLDVGRFDTGNDADFLDRLYIPGIRRAGDFQTAVEDASSVIVVHDAGEHFSVSGPRVIPEKLTPREIVSLMTQPRH
jgi:hypothetical protein